MPTKNTNTLVPMYHLELVRDVASFSYTKVDSAEAAAEVFHQLLDNSHVEKLAVIYCNAGAEMIGAEVVAIGNIDRVGADMSDIFKGALKANAAMIWLAHNHPGTTKGKAEASLPDYLFTTKVLESSEILGIPLIDHLVIQPGSHYSIKENAATLQAKVKREREKQPRNPLDLIFGMAASEDKPWKRGINPTWTHMGCDCSTCTAKGKH